MNMLMFPLSLIVLPVISGSNIAMFMSIGGPSHVNIFTAVAKVLIEDGHNITFFNGLTNKCFKNFTSIQPQEFVDNKTNRKTYIDTLFQERINDVIVPEINYHLFENSIAICKIFFESAEWSNVINSDIQFDLVIINPLFGECGLVLGYYYKAPVVYLGTSGLYTWITPAFANPSTILYKPTVLVASSQDVRDFSQRLYSTITYIVTRFLQVWYTYPKTEELFRRHFGSDVPSVLEMEGNVSLMFLDTNIGVEPPVPYMPNIVEIAGIHSHPAQPLSKDYCEFVDNSSGVILFALGSLVKSTDMPPSFRKNLLNVFSKLPYNVIWTWDDENMDGITIPRNVKITKWMPQKDLLGHKKTKLFITHGGKQSSIEALYHGVPVIVVPVFSDQDLHAFLAKDREYGIILDAKDLASSERVMNAITTVLNNKKYEENAKKYSIVLTDQPLSPKDRVSYWTNYVLRHNNGIPLMKTTARSMHWIEYYLVDVLFSITLSTIVFIVIIKKITFIIKKLIIR